MYYPISIEPGAPASSDDASEERIFTRAAEYSTFNDYETALVLGEVYINVGECFEKTA